MARLDNVWIGIKELGYNSIEDSCVAFVLSRNFRGARKSRSALAHQLEDLRNKIKTIKDWDARDNVVKIV